MFCSPEKKIFEISFWSHPKELTFDGWVRQTYSDNDVLSAIVEGLITRSRIDDSQALMSEVTPGILALKESTPVRSSMAQPMIKYHTLVNSPPAQLRPLIETKSAGLFNPTFS